MQRSFFTCLIALLYSLTSFGFAQINIAFLAPLSGDESLLTPEAERLAEITVALFNESTGLDVQLLKFDTQSDASVALRLANEIGQDESIVATIGPFVNHICAATRQVFNNYKLANITPRCSQTALASDTWLTFFQALPSDQAQSGFLAYHWLYGNFDWVNALLIEDQTSYATNLNFDVDTFMKNSMNFSNRVAVAETQLYFGDIADDLLEYDVRLVLFSSLSVLQQSELAKELHARDYEGLVFFPNSGFNAEWVTRAGEAAEGVYVTSFYPPPEQEQAMQPYIERYQDQTGKMFGWSGVTSLLASYITLKAVENCRGKLERTCVLGRLATLDLESTPLGIPISFKAGALEDASFATYQIQAGEYVKVWPPDSE